MEFIKLYFHGTPHFFIWPEQFMNCFCTIHDMSQGQNTIQQSQYTKRNTSQIKYLMMTKQGRQLTSLTTHILVQNLWFLSSSI